jgi:ComF family protein
LSIDGVFTSVVYAGIVKRLIYQFKFQPYLRDVRSSIDELFAEGLIQNETFFTIKKKDAYVVPIPLFPAKERKRGYNHAALLAQELVRHFNLPVVPSLLRQRQTLPQYGLTQLERRTNIKDAFTLSTKGKENVVGKTIFLVDDIVTSGATMQEAAKVFKKAGAKEVWGLAFAHGE